MKNSKILRVVIIGCGELGKILAEKLIKDPRFHLLGILDSDLNKVGKLVAGIEVKDDLDKFILGSNLDLIFITTSSTIEKIKTLLMKIIEAGINVVSSCEELVFPWVSHNDLAQQIDSMAKTYKVRVLGTGINPGFLMDYFLSILSMAFLEIKKIEYFRSINTEHRRKAFKVKVGQGLSLNEFESKLSAGLLGHVGLKQSVDLLSTALNWELKTYKESIQPLTEPLEASANEPFVLGISQTAHFEFLKNKSISLKFIAGLNQVDKDIIKIETEDGRETELEIKNGINGETGTVSVLINSAEKIMKLSPGLKTMCDF